MTNNKKEKPRIHHLHKGYTEDGKFTPQHTEAVKLADRIFNYPSSTREQPLRERPNINRKPGKRRK